MSEKANAPAMDRGARAFPCAAATLEEYRAGTGGSTDRFEADMAVALDALDILARSAPVLDDATHYHATLLVEVRNLLRYAARALASDRRQWKRRALPLRPAERADASAAQASRHGDDEGALAAREVA